VFSFLSKSRISSPGQPLFNTKNELQAREDPLPKIPRFGNLIRSGQLVQESSLICFKASTASATHLINTSTSLFS